MASSVSAAAFTVAIWLCGACCSRPGEKIITKLMERLDQSTSRRLAMVTSTSRPRMLMVSLSPVPIPSARPISISEEHTSELQSLMRISYAVFCFKKKLITQLQTSYTHTYYHNLTLLLPYHSSISAHT